MSDFLRKIIAKNQRKKSENQEANQPKVENNNPNVMEFHDIPCILKGYGVDIYRRTDNTEKLPIVFVIHGGGFMAGSKEFNRPLCLHLANEGYLVYALEYPKVPEFTIDKVVKHIIMQINYIIKNIGEDGDTTNVYIVGDSAGAYLATMVTAIIHNRNLAEDLDFDSVVPNIHINALGLICGLFYVRSYSFIGRFFNWLLFNRNMKNDVFWMCADVESMDIINYLPPCALFTSSGDFLKNDTIKFDDALNENGNICLLDYLEDDTLIHDFPLFLCDRKDADRVFRGIEEVFDYFIRKQK